MYEHGRIHEIQIITFGSELSADTGAGATALVVEDAADFDEAGGTLVINDQVIEYSSCDDDTGTITLAEALANDAEEGDRVKLYDPLYSAVVTSKIAQVKVDGDLDDADPIEAVIAMHLVDKLAEGIRGIKGESVLLELDDDEWRVVDVLGFGDPDAGGPQGTLFYQDATEVAAPGDQTVNLTFLPIQNSEHVYWNGLYQPGTEWSRSGQVITVPDPDNFARPGDRITVEYAYRVGHNAPPSDVGQPPTEGLLLWYKFDESVAGTAYDSSGNNLDGISEGFTYAGQPSARPDGEGGAWIFAGGDICEVRRDFVPLTHFSVSLWCYFTIDDYMPNSMAFASLGESSSGNAVSLYMVGQKMHIQQALGSSAFGDTTITYPGPHHLVWVYDEDLLTMTFYLDGVEDGGGAVTPWDISEGQLLIGTNHHDQLQAVGVTDFRLYGVPLTAEDVETLYLDGAT